MKHNKPGKPIPPELAEEYDDYVDDAVALAKGSLSPERAAAVRQRMADDPMYRAVIEPIVDAYDAPPLSEAEFHEKWASFQRRAGISQVALEPAADAADLAAFEERVRGREGVWRRRLMKLAAAVLVVFTLFPISWLVLEWTFWTKHSTAANVTATIDLPDGSVATLSPSSGIKYLDDMTSGNGTFRRDVGMTGTVEFTVAPLVNTKRFEVTTRHAQIVAVGTRFRVEELDGFTRVRVDEGRVTVQSRRDGELVGTPVTLDAGSSARALPSGVVPEPNPSQRTP